VPKWQAHRALAFTDSEFHRYGPSGSSVAPRDALGLAQLDQTVEFSYASVLGAILYFEGKQLATHFGDEIHFPVFFATPAREAHGLRAVAGNRCLNTA